MVDITLDTTATVPTGATLTVTVYEDTDGDGTADNQAEQSVADGTNSYTLSGFDGSSGNDYWLHVWTTNDDPTERTELSSSEITRLQTDIPSTVTSTTSVSTVTSTTSSTDSPSTATSTVSTTSTETTTSVDIPTPIASTASIQTTTETTTSVDTPSTIIPTVSLSSSETTTSVDTPSTLTTSVTIATITASSFLSYPFTGLEPVEYVEESTFGSAVSNPNMNWIGLVTNYQSNISVESAQFRLTSSSDKVASKKENIKMNEAISIDLTYVPQDFTFLQYFTGADGSISDTMESVQIGEKQTDIKIGVAGTSNNETEERRRLLGVVGETWTLTIPADGVASINASMMAIDKEDWSDTDYIGSGSHASEDVSSPITYDDLGNIQLGGTDIHHFISQLTLEVKNKFKIFRTEAASTDTEINSVMLTDRQIKVGMDISYANNNFVDTVTNFNKQDFTFNVNGTSFTVNDVQFPEFQNIQIPGQLAGMSVTSEPASDMTYG